VIRVIIAEDHKIVRSGLLHFFHTVPDIEVIADTGLGQEAVRLTQELRPDVLLLDMDLPDINGMDVMSRLSDSGASVSILFLTMYDNVELASQLMKAGARGFIVKSGEPEELVEALRKIHSGGIYLTPAIRDEMLKSQFTVTPGADSLKDLSQREMQVLLKMAQGDSNADIAEKLCISEGTVKTYKHRIQTKLGIRKNVDLVRFCIKQGLIDK
jgi:DNA-binding NarL/FixJ family response regulator